MNFNYRKIIYDALCEIFDCNQFVNIYTNKILNTKIENYDNKIKSIIKKEIYGIIENKILIDYIINKYNKSKKINKKIKYVLYIGVYELLFLNNKKSYATINECVEIAKNINLFLSKFVNAVLKNIDSKENIADIYSNNNIEEYIKYSIPKDLYDYLLNNLNCYYNENQKKQKIIDIFKYFNNDEKIILRVDSFDKNIKQKIINEFEYNNIKYELYDSGLNLEYFDVFVVKNVGDIKKYEMFNKGLIYIEDISSIYYIEQIFDIIRNGFLNKNNISIYDVCSAPGGKFLGLYKLCSEFLKSYKCEFYINDILSKKIEFIIQNLKRLNIKSFQLIDTSQDCKSNNVNINLTVADGCLLNKNYINKFAVVMVDAPCSGLGSISKKPDIKYNFDINKLKKLTACQNQLLDINKLYVEEGGILCYSTCTITFDENENVVNEFLNNNKNFKLLLKKQIMPSEYNSDGLYYAIMKKYN